MTASRPASWTLLLAAGFALRPAPAGAQDPPLPTRPNLDFVTAARDGRGISKEELDTTRKQMAALAQYYAAWVAHPLVHKAAADPGKVPPGAFFLTVDGAIAELNRYVADPTPANAARWTADKADYIRELGVALDAPLKKLVETDPDRVVRVNAARVHAAVCRSGAAAHWPTVTEWLTNPNTPTEIKQYALQAAANLLAAYDVSDYNTRRHAVPFGKGAGGANKDVARADANKVIGALVAAVDKCVTDPNALVAFPGGKVADAGPDQVAVAAFVRRQAVRALAQVRFVTLPGPDGQTPLYPAVTLARVCLADPALAPAPGLVPTPADCGEAVIGLCNMAPMVEAAAAKNAYVPLKGYNHHAAAEAVAAGLVTFATPRVDPLNRSLPWRWYAARVGDAVRNWRPLFDPRFEATRPAVYNPKLTEAPGSPVAELVQRTQELIITPMEKVDAGGKPDLAARVGIEEMRALLRRLQADPKRSAELVEGVPATRLPLAPKK
ncbi:MAG: hypothetical protein C0501_22120 [Isosphaera sp.]|nr:hypothetical protein [Isosphaera sp.]